MEWFNPPLTPNQSLMCLEIEENRLMLITLRADMEVETDVVFPAFLFGFPEVSSFLFLFL